MNELLKNKKLIAALFLLLVFAILTIFGLQEHQNSISSELGIDVSNGNEISHLDTHRGFHGDGKTYIVLRFSDNDALKQIEESTQWKEFPLDETVEALVYGISDETSRTGPFLTDGEGNALVPKIQRGYYLLIDRHTEAGKAAGTNILHRNSLNFTLGLYDINSNTLYFCKLDT